MFSYENTLLVGSHVNFSLGPMGTPRRTDGPRRSRPTPSPPRTPTLNPSTQAVHRDDEGRSQRGRPFTSTIATERLPNTPPKVLHRYLRRRVTDRTTVHGSRQPHRDRERVQMFSPVAGPTSYRGSFRRNQNFGGEPRDDKFC